MRAPRFLCAASTVLMSMSVWPSVVAQTPAVATFVASIKPVGDERQPFPLRITPRGGLVGRATLAVAIRLAYETEPCERVVAANQDISDKLENRYEFNARPEPAASVPSRADVAAMARLMLADRFGLKLKVETEPARATVLRTIKPGVLGPGLRPAPEGCRPLPTTADFADARFDDAYRRNCVLTTFGNRIRGTATLDELARLLSFGGQRPYLNRTNLTGQFAIDVTVAKTSWFTVMPTKEDEGPALVNALRDQMGLTARTERQPIRMIVVEEVGPLVEN